MVLDEETVRWQGRGGVSVGVAASAEYRHVDQLKRTVVLLSARVEALREAEENLNLDKLVKLRSQQRSVRMKMASEREGVEAEMDAVESELEAAVAAPASGGRDPTSWLADELLIVIMMLVSMEALWTGRCAGVCRRWRAVVESGPVKRRKRKGKWEAYANEWIEPRTLGRELRNCINCIAAGLDGTIYSSSDSMVRVWSGGNEIRRLEGHTDWVLGLAVGLDGTVYTGSVDNTVRVWSGEDGAHIRTLSGHVDTIRDLALGLNDKLYSGSNDFDIRVWSTRDGAHIQTLEGHTRGVIALLLGLDGRVYSASHDCTIRVWSGDDGAHLQTLEGHDDDVTSMVWGPDGKLYSGSNDCTIRVWSEGGTTIFQTVESGIWSLACVDGHLFAPCASDMSRSRSRDIWVWSSDQLSPTDPPSHVLDGDVYGRCGLVGGSTGNLYAIGPSGELVKM